MKLDLLIHYLVTELNSESLILAVGDQKLLNQYPEVIISHITDDSREVDTGSLFIAVPGLRMDGRKFIADAIERGAAAIFYQPMDTASSPEFEISHTDYSPAIPVVPIPNLLSLVGLLASFFYGQPSSKIKVIGITGTNGKTSCSHYLAQVLSKVGQTCAVAGTVGNGFLPQLMPSKLTTVSSIHLQRNLAKFFNQGAKTVAMEVSSHSLTQHRVEGIEFAVAVLTHLSRDHLDYHGTMEAYAAAKSLLFVQPHLKKAVLNWDDPLGKTLIQRHQSNLEIIGYSATGSKHPKVPSVVAENIELSPHGFQFNLITPWGQSWVTVPLLGRFNISNVLAVVSVLGLFEVPFAEIVKHLSQLHSVVGRMELFQAKNKPQVIVDYAHTPDALEKVLLSLREHQPKKLWCIFGCGGDRDQGKRPLMAKVVEQYAEEITITNDNPRHEDPEQIITGIVGGLSESTKYRVQLDRAEAIANVIAQANSEDIVLVAGKGHEQVQIIGSQEFPFSDQAIVLKCLAME